MSRNRNSHRSEPEVFHGPHDQFQGVSIDAFYAMQNLHIDLGVLRPENAVCIPQDELDRRRHLAEEGAVSVDARLMDVPAYAVEIAAGRLRPDQAPADIQDVLGSFSSKHDVEAPQP